MPIAKTYEYKGKTFTDVKLDECERHGLFPVWGTNSAGYGQTLYTKCPKCEKAAQALKGACIPKRFTGKRVRDYITSCDGQRRAKEVVTDYCSDIDQKIRDGVSLIFSGTTGAGKTHLAASIAVRAADCAHSVLFTTTIDYITRVKESWRNGAKETESDVLRKFVDFELLILDEVGIQFGTESERLILFRLLNERYNAVKPTILISNLPVELSEKERREGGKTISDYLGERLYDRILEGGGQCVAFTWPSYRKQLKTVQEKKEGGN